MSYHLKDKNIVFFGAGAIGSTIGGWLAPYHSSLYFLDQGAVLEKLKNEGLQLFQGDRPSEKEKISVKTISNLNELKKIDIIFLAVKNYSLDFVSQLIVQNAGKDVLIVALQNGVENQKILPKYFSRIIYGVIGYNAWPSESGIYGYQKKGPVVLGTLNPTDLQDEKLAIKELMEKGVETIIKDDFQSAAYSKMIINLTNSLTTLIGHGYRELSSLKLMQKILSQMTYEGIQIVKAAGIKECSIGGMPSWFLMTAAAKLPSCLTRAVFKKNLKKMVLSSMAQDIIQNKSGQSELESINGHLLKMANEFHVNAPYNREIYNLCSSEFGKKDFKTLDIQEVWEKIKNKV